MSSNSNLTFPHIIKILSRCLSPLILFFGNISCLLSFIIFLQKPMRKNSSGLYFLSLIICDMIYINVAMTTSILDLGYSIDYAAGSSVLCQFQYYITIVSSLLSSSFLVLASIDRFILTSSNAGIKRLNSRSMAIKLIISLIVFCCILHIHIFFFVGYGKDPRNPFICAFSPGTYLLVLSWYIFVVFGFLTPLSMIIFGIRTIINVRRVLIHSTHRLYSIDRQLILIMLSQCFIYVIFCIPLSIYFIYKYVIQNSLETEQNYSTQIIFFYISSICFFIPYCSFFFVNLISYSFRMEFRRIVSKFFKRRIRCLRKCRQGRRQRVYPLGMIQRPVAVVRTQVHM